MYSSLHLARIEENMRVILENHYTNALKKRWADKIYKEIPGTASKEHLYFVITGGAMDYGVEGNIRFEDQDVARIDLEPKFVDVPALRILKSELDDSEGAGLSKARDWASAAGVKAALFAQQKLAAAILANPNCYDGGAFFRTNHKLGATTFANDFTSSASGNYPGALPLTGEAATVSANIGKAIAYIRSIMAPDGVTPMNLEPKYLLLPPSLHRPGIIGTGARFVAGSSGGTTDVAAVISDYGLEPIMAPELGTDTCAYIVCEPVGTEVGPWIYLNREPCTVNWYGPQISAELNRKRVLEYTMAGRAIVAPGRPEFMFRLKPS